jgi:glycosyltransferase involved in cell wall biosynthesis
MPALRAQGVDVALHCAFNPRLGRPKWLGEFQKLAIPTYLKSVGSPASASDLLDVIRIVRERGVTILHSFDHRSDVVALMAARFTGISFIASFAGWTNWDGELFKERAYMAVDRWTLGKADAVLIDSKHVGIAARISTRPHPVVVIPNGVDLARFSCEINGDLKQQFFGSTNVQLLGIVGRIHPNKRQLDFVRAAADLSRQHPETRFLIVGAAPAGFEEYARKVQEMIGQYGLGDKVRMIVASPEDIPKITSEIDILLAPCHTESCSFAIIEAMASGKPVVAAHAGGNPELVVEDETGLLVPPKDWTALRDAADRLIREKDLRIRLGEAGLRRATTGLTVEHMVERTRAVYETVLRLPRRSGERRKQLERDGFVLL